MTAAEGLGTFEPVERRTVSAEVRQRLIDAIRSGALAPGQPLPAERVLCQEFGVARTSVREAIQGLVTAGYVERRGNRAVVADVPPTLDSRKVTVRELFEVRRVIEPAMAALAATRASDDDRHELDGLAARDPSSLEDFRSIDRSFHAVIARACGNPMLADMYARTLSALFASGEFASLLYAEENRDEVSAIIESATAGHRAIAHAIVTADGPATVIAVSSHLADVERRMLERLR